MGIIGGTLGYKILKYICPDGNSGYMDGSAYLNKSKLEAMFGASIWTKIQGKVVLDFGCGTGLEAVEMARHGAKKVIGIDIQDKLLDKARKIAKHFGVSNYCTFSKQTTEQVDVIITIDTFEHFSDPKLVLNTMRKLINFDGCIIAAFGPTWYHPLGGHLFSVFPWSHLIFSEKALIRWRSDFRADKATCFRRVEGGLNQMTIRRFERIVEKSPLKIGHLETVPIRKLRWVANKITREFTTAIVRSTLVARTNAYTKQ